MPVTPKHNIYFSSLDDAARGQFQDQSQAESIDSALTKLADSIAKEVEVTVVPTAVVEDLEDGTGWLYTRMDDEGPGGGGGGGASLDQVKAWLSSEGTLPVNAVTQYGVRGDGAKDDRAGLQKAIDETSAAGKALYLPKGRYRVTSSLRLRTNSDVICHPDAVIDGSSITSSDVIRADGIRDSAIAITGATAGSFQINMPNSGLVEGDWITVNSTDIWDASSTNVQQGEIVEVLRVSGTKVDLASPLHDNYTSQPEARKINTVTNLKWRGGVILGARTAGASQNGIALRYVIDARLDGITFRGFDAAAISINNSVRCWVDNSKFFNAITRVMGYGISFGNAVRDSGATRCIFTDIRHCFSTNNTVYSSGPPNTGGIVRRIHFSQNVCQWTSGATAGSMASGGAAIDTHTAAQDIYVYENSVIGSRGEGINIECTSAAVRNNLIVRAAGTGISIHNESDRNGDMQVTDNRIIDCDGTGIYARSGARGGSGRSNSMFIVNNYVKAGKDQVGIRIGFSVTEIGVQTSGNRVISNTIGIDIRTVAGAVIGPDSIDGGQTCLNIANASNTLITPGAFFSASGTGLVAPTSSSVTVGPTAHINAPTKRG